MSDMGIGCQDNSCIFKILRGAGVGTNGGCRCFEALISWNEEAKQWNRPEVRKVQHDTQRLAHALRATQKRIEELEAALTQLRGDPRLWRRGGAGGQDEYAGLPPAMRIIDAALRKVKP